MAPKAAAKAALKNTLAAYGPDMGNDAIKCLVCGEGSKTFPSWTSLKKHLLRSHPISATDLKGTYVAQMTVPVPNLPLTLRGQGALDIHVRFERKGNMIF